jgi:RimJ/RimL family protein N-acetyltransferase
MVYFLRTARLSFRCWSEGDLPLALALWGDPAVTALIGGPFTPETVRERLHRGIALMRQHGVQYWPAFLSDGAQFIGCAGLRPYRLEDGIYEFGVHLRPAFQGKGFAREAANAIIYHAFGTLRAESLFAGHHPRNEASRRILAKLGFVATHEELYAPTGLMHPSCLLRRPQALS